MATHFDRQQIVEFLRKAGEDLKRTGDELRAEAHRLLDEVRDPANQQRIKERIDELGGWLKRTTQDAADVIESAVRRAESTLRMEIRKRVPRRAAAKRSGGKGGSRRKSAPRRKKSTPAT